MIEDRIFPITPPRSDSEALDKSEFVKVADYSMTTPNNRSGTDEPLRPPSAIRRSRSPPKNDVGQIICDHVDCQGKTPTFRRPCEWNKHMDRHERPYKCYEIGCEINPGFTYSGGLLRHQREVHKMYSSSSRQPLYCPVPNCNRSHGAGFTRRENLEEHKRRRHVGDLQYTSPSPPIRPVKHARTSYQHSYDSQSNNPRPLLGFDSRQNENQIKPSQLQPLTESRKRKITTPTRQEDENGDELEEEDLESGDEEDEDEENGYEQEDHQEQNETDHVKEKLGNEVDNDVDQAKANIHWTIHPTISLQQTGTTATHDDLHHSHLIIIKRLHAKLTQQEEVIRHQSMEIHRLQNILRALPTQAIYEVMKSSEPANLSSNLNGAGIGSRG